VLVSQPSFGSPLQSPKPELHAGAHTPPLQLVVPFAFEQAVPHAPQLPMSLPRLVSQPLETSPSQLPKPELQLIEQVLPEQDGTPPALLHACPQPAQWLGSFVVFTSQPFASSPSQSA
jgi:hypothetical protein